MASTTNPAFIPCLFQVFDEEEEEYDICGKHSDNGRCNEHDGITCVSCGKPASRKCEALGHSECGRPLCELCVHSPSEMGAQHITRVAASTILAEQHIAMAYPFDVAAHFYKHT